MAVHSELDQGGVAWTDGADLHLQVDGLQVEVQVDLGAELLVAQQAVGCGHRHFGRGVRTER